MCLTDIGIEGRLRDAHYGADLLHSQPLLLVQLYRPLLLARGQRFWASAHAASGSGRLQSRLRAFQDQLPCECCQCRKNEMLIMCGDSCVSDVHSGPDTTGNHSLGTKFILTLFSSRVYYPNLGSHATENGKRDDRKRNLEFI